MLLSFKPSAHRTYCITLIQLPYLRSAIIIKWIFFSVLIGFWLESVVENVESDFLGNKRGTFLSSLFYRFNMLFSSAQPECLSLYYSKCSIKFINNMCSKLTQL